jgi:hypothetical protein
MTNPYKGGGELPDYLKFQCMRQLNQELLERLKASQEENAKLKLLLEVNGREKSACEGAGNPEEREGEEQVIQEVEGAREETEENEEGIIDPPHPLIFVENPVSDISTR